MFTIVKFAADRIWSVYGFSRDPKETGVDLSKSAADTHAGKLAKIQHTYPTEKSANRACAKMNNYDQSGYYAVCPVVVKEETNAA